MIITFKQRQSCVSDITSVCIFLAYKSCAELLNAGFAEDGVYQILSDQSEVIDIYCDQSSWGGGNRNDTSCDPQTVSQRVAMSGLNHVRESE